MAVDTRQKRFSMMTFGSPAPLKALFEADGTVDADDMYQMLGLYSGITLDNPTPVTTTVLDYGRNLMRGMFRGMSR